MPTYLGAIDQGTSSTRFIVFDESTRIVAESQIEHAQIYPQLRWRSGATLRPSSPVHCAAAA